MGFQIEDGTGQSYKAQVTPGNRLAVYSAIENTLAFQSRENASAYVWTAVQDWGADVNALWLRNDSSTHDLHIERVLISPPADCFTEIYLGEGSTAGGVEVVGTNLNLGSGNVASVTCTHTNTNVDAGAGLTRLTAFYSTIGRTVLSTLGSVILPLNAEIAINLVTDVGLTSVVIAGYYQVD